MSRGLQVDAKHVLVHQTEEEEDGEEQVAAVSWMIAHSQALAGSAIHSAHVPAVNRGRL